MVCKDSLLTIQTSKWCKTDDTIYEHQFAPEDVLGLDHVDKSGKPRSGTGEKALTIR